MVNHGISTGALFLLVGVIYDRRHTRMVDEFGGLAKVMPVYAALFLIVTFASIGVPGTNGFIGEFMIITGTFVVGAPRRRSPASTPSAPPPASSSPRSTCSAWCRRCSSARSRTRRTSTCPTSPRARSLALAPLVVDDLRDRPLPVDLPRPDEGRGARSPTRTFKTVSGQAILYADDKDAKILPADVFPAAFLKGGAARARTAPTGRRRGGRSGAAPPGGAQMKLGVFARGLAAARGRRSAALLLDARRGVLAPPRGGATRARTAPRRRSRWPRRSRSSPARSCRAAVWMVGPGDIARWRPRCSRRSWSSTASRSSSTFVLCLGGALAALLAGGYLPEHELDRGEFYPLLTFSTVGAMMLAARGRRALALPRARDDVARRLRADRLPPRVAAQRPRRR